MSSKNWVIPKHRLSITPSVSVPGRSAIDRKDKCVLYSEGTVWVLQIITVDKSYKNRKGGALVIPLILWEMLWHLIRKKF